MNVVSKRKILPYQKITQVIQLVLSQFTDRAVLVPFVLFTKHYGDKIGEGMWWGMSPVRDR
jgi:hypothetical protein